MNSNYKKAYSFFLFLFITAISFSQPADIKKVTLIKKQNGKRLEFYAKNIDSISYSVFLRISTDNYRRSSNRPVLKVIPAESQTHLITLIKLTGKPDAYKEQFIVNKVVQNLRIRKDPEDFEINFDNALKTEDITIFESDNCELCEDAKTLLNNYQIAFKTKHITKDYRDLKPFLAQLEIKKDSLKKLPLILQIKSDIYTSINTEKGFIDTINNYNKE